MDLVSCIKLQTHVDTYDNESYYFDSRTGGMGSFASHVKLQTHMEP